MGINIKIVVSNSGADNKKKKKKEKKPHMDSYLIRNGWNAD